VNAAARENPYSLNSVLFRGADKAGLETPAPSKAWIICSIATKSVLVLCLTANIATIIALSVAALGVLLIVSSSLGAIAFALSLCQDICVMLAVRGLGAEQLCALWEKNLAEIRPGGERIAAGAVIQAQFFPCAIAMRDSMLRKLREDAAHLPEHRVAEIQDRCVRAFNGELETYEELKFTGRMRYTTMDDFLFLLSHWARTELGLAKAITRKKRCDCLVFSGGGAAGVGYTPLFQLFFSPEAADVFEEDCKFIGSSAGALSALCGAFGPHDMREPTLEMQKACLTFSSSLGLRKAYPTFSAGLGGGFIEGLSAVEVVDRYASRQVRTFLEAIPDHVFASYLSPEERGRIGQLRQPYDLSACREPLMVRFSDIELLRKLPNGKKFFHLVAISMWNSEKNQTFYASHRTTPNFPVAYAARVSMSVPFVFKRAHMAIPGLDGDGSACHYYDGGIEQAEPNPEDAFGANGCAKPLHCILDGDGSAYSDSGCDDFITDFRLWLLRRAHIVGDDIGERRRANWMDARRGHFMAVPHAAVGTFNFWFSQTDLEAAAYQSAMAGYATMIRLRETE
jgi:hypothetical protein